MRSGNGYTFVELLLALLLFSLGAMAVAAMQFGAVQATRSASESAAALILAEDLAQRLLASADDFAAYEKVLDGDPARADDVAASCLDDVLCEPDAWAERGVAEWQVLSEQGGLSLLRACIAVEISELRIGLSWVSRSGAPPVPGAFCTSEGDPDDRRAVTLSAPLAVAP